MAGALTISIGSVNGTPTIAISLADGELMDANITRLTSVLLTAATQEQEKMLDEGIEVNYLIFDSPNVSKITANREQKPKAKRAKKPVDKS